MKPVTVLRIAGWVLFLAGAAIVFAVSGGLDRAVREPIGWVGITCILVGIVGNIISTLIRLWPRKPAPKVDDSE
jgi:hypothetical protein